MAFVNFEQELSDAMSLAERLFRFRSFRRVNPTTVKLGRYTLALATIKSGHQWRLYDRCSSEENGEDLEPILLEEFEIVTDGMITMVSRFAGDCFDLAARGAMQPSPDAAERALRYILDRVVCDRNFSWRMMGTETLALCLKAVAEIDGTTREVVEQDLHDRMNDAQPRLDAQGQGVADALLYRKRFERIEELLGDHAMRGNFDGTAYQELHSALHDDPAVWEKETT